jgi:hypothetical protein
MNSDNSTHNPKLLNRYKKLKELALAMRPDKMEQNFHVSFISYKGRVVSVGVNNKKTHPLNLKNPKINREGLDISECKFTCSELNAFVKLKNLTNVPFNKCTLVNIRILRNGKFGYAAPCQSCRSLISYLSIRKVYYTDFTGNISEYIG